MNKLQGVVLALFALVGGALVWGFCYAAIYDIRIFLRTRSFSGQFLGVLSEDVAAPHRHVWQNWPPLSQIGQWGGSFVVTTALMACVPALVGLIAAFIIRHQLKMPDYHGDARLMKHSEISKEGMAQKSGLILGQAGNVRIIDSEQSHAVVIGPPASGKTESIVIPNLIEWDGSFIAIDFKGTLYDRTARIRAAQGDAVYLLAPGFEDSHTYNPLDLLRAPPFRITDIQALATLIVPTGEGKEVHWNRGAQTLLSGLLGFVLESRECDGKRTLSTVVDMFSATKNMKKTCEMITRDPDISEWTRARIMEFMGVPDEEAGSFQSTLNGNLLAWQNPAVAALTSTTANAVKLEDVRKVRMAVYLKIDTGQIDIFAPVLRLFLEQVNSIVNREYRQEGEHKILFMIDEFYQLGRVKSIINQLPFARDRDIRIVLVSQGIAQVDEKFGRDGRESIMASCALKIFCSFNDKPTVDLVTHMGGQTTQRITTISKQMPQGGGFARKTRNEQYQARPLFRPDELFAWPRNDILIMRVNKNPLIGTKILADKTAKYVKKVKAAAGVKLIAPALKIPSKFIPSWGVRADERQAQANAEGVAENRSIEARHSEQTPALAQPETPVAVVSSALDYSALETASKLSPAKSTPALVASLASHRVDLSKVSDAPLEKPAVRLRKTFDESWKIADAALDKVRELQSTGVATKGEAASLMNDLVGDLLNVAQVAAAGPVEDEEAAA